VCDLVPVQYGVLLRKLVKMVQCRCWYEENKLGRLDLETKGNWRWRSTSELVGDGQMRRRCRRS
jgi:hypothetical protein